MCQYNIFNAEMTQLWLMWYIRAGRRPRALVKGNEDLISQDNSRRVNHHAKVLV